MSSLTDLATAFIIKLYNSFILEREEKVKTHSVSLFPLGLEIEN